MRVFKTRPVWTSPPCSFARAVELGTTCSIHAKPVATRERRSSGSTTGAGLSPLTAKSGERQGRRAPTCANRGTGPGAFLRMQCKRGSPSYTLGCSSSQCIRAWMHQQPRPMKLDETHKKKTDSQRSAVQATRAARAAEKRAEKKRAEEEKQAEARPAEEAVLSRMQPASGRGAAAGETKVPS